jgi:glycosyltransferase involved in cell wall biosynthesis
MSNQPLVSIAMPVHNGEITLPVALSSVMWQSYENWELLLMDDGSTDGSLTLCEDFSDPRIRVFSDGQRHGLPNRMNAAIDLARGEYFARLDSDDLAYPWRLERQVKFLQKNRAIDLLGTGAMVFADNGKPIGRFPLREKHEEICRTPLSGFYLAHPTWMGKTSWFKTHKYNPVMLKAQDQELLLRTYHQSIFACLPEILTGYRQTTLSLKKILRGRYHFARALILNHGSEPKGALMQALVMQALKAAFDLFAITTRLNRKLLKHRALPADPGELQQWQELWFKLNEPR